MTEERDQDELRTKRAFVNFLASALGTDQNYIGDDGNPTNRPGEYVIVNGETGNYSVLGQSSSNLNRGAPQPALAITPGVLLLIGAALFLILRR